jgi:hypothetical protein
MFAHMPGIALLVCEPWRGLEWVSVSCSQKPLGLLDSDAWVFPLE